MKTEDSARRENSMARRIGNLLSPKKGRSATSTSGLRDDVTQFSVEGEKSVAVTVDSQVTVKASNRRFMRLSPKKGSKKGNKKETDSKSPAKGGWRTLKRLVVGVPGTATSRSDSKSEGCKSDRFLRSDGSVKSGSNTRRRVWSEDDKRKQNSSGDSPAVSVRVRNQLDMAIRGRLDGVDILSLGRAARSINPEQCRNIQPQTAATRKNADSTAFATSLLFDPFQMSFTGSPSRQLPAALISSMINSSAGREQAELILEGFIPGGGDRWNVILSNEEDHPQRANSSAGDTGNGVPNSTDDTDDDTAELTDDGSTNMPSHILWDQIWGHSSPPPTPSHMQSGNSSGDEEEDIMQLAAACSVPIDLDEDTFIIDGPEHYNAVRDLVMIPLQGRRFESAIGIFKKMLQGLQERNDPTLEHLQASIHHNVGMVYLCQSKFDEAATSFNAASEIRTQCLSQNHPDVAVSLVRQGQAAFGMENFKKAQELFQVALDMSPAEDATRAKILSNIGTVHFYQGNYAESLSAFTAALEIQRQWLVGPVRRDSMVYDASVTLGNMGNVFLQMGEADIAYSVFEEACLLQVTAFRKDHCIVLTSLENMALTQAKQGLYDKASPILKSVLRSRELSLGPNHAVTIETIGALAFVLSEEMELESSLELLRRLAAWQEDNLTQDHPTFKATTEKISIVEKMIKDKTSLWV